MKFRNPVSNFERTHDRKDRWTDRQVESNMPLKLFQSWGHKTHPGSGSDQTFASERRNTALATLYIGASVTCPK